MADAGGADALSEAERSVVRRAATLTVELERLEQAFALAGEADPQSLDLYARTAGNLRRLLESLGLGSAAGPRTITINPTGRTDNDAARRVAFALAMARREPVTDVETA